MALSRFPELNSSFSCCEGLMEALLERLTLPATAAADSERQQQLLALQVCVKGGAGGAHPGSVGEGPPG